MKKLLLSFLLLVGVAFATGNESDEELQSRAYLGCKAYPSWHSKSCKTNKQHIYQGAACKYWKLCSY